MLAMSEGSIPHDQHDKKTSQNDSVLENYPLEMTNWLDQIEMQPFTEQIDVRRLVELVRVAEDVIDKLPVSLAEKYKSIRTIVIQNPLSPTQKEEHSLSMSVKSSDLEVLRDEMRRLQGMVKTLMDGSAAEAAEAPEHSEHSAHEAAQSPPSGEAASNALEQLRLQHEHDSEQMKDAMEAAHSQEISTLKLRHSQQIALLENDRKSEQEQLQKVIQLQQQQLDAWKLELEQSQITHKNTLASLRERMFELSEQVRKQSSVIDAQLSQIEESEKARKAKEQEHQEEIKAMVSWASFADLEDLTKHLFGIIDDLQQEKLTWKQQKRQLREENVGLKKTAWNVQSQPVKAEVEEATQVLADFEAARNSLMRHLHLEGEATKANPKPKKKHTLHKRIM